ncbi:MAG: FAD-binding oxidoreductase, partial [Planctomycetes bacterium]|nr:FAD-binding oxidoreductase [Planctomycetota bacterium]
MIKTADAVVIGGGVIGTSVAYHLVKNGLKNIVLLEKNLLGSGSTGKAAGLTIHQWNTEIDIRLVRGSLEIYKELLGHRHKEIFHQCGLVYLATSSAEEGYLKQSQGLLKTIEIKSEWLDESDIRKRLPIRADGFKSGLHTSEDGYIDPYEVTSAFGASVRKNGGKVYEMTPVTGMETAGGMNQSSVHTGGKVAAVTTPDGTISTSIVIIAAGCWTKKVGNLIGLKLPLKPYRTQIAILKPTQPLPSQFPAVYDMNKNIYFHGETGG